MKIRTIINLALILLCCASCSIKEDRQSCYCILTIVPEGVPGGLIQSSPLLLSINGKSYHAEKILENSSAVTFHVPQETVSSSMMSREGTKIFAGMTKTDCRHESTQDTVTIFRQFAQMLITIDSPEKEYRIRLRAQTSDIDPLSLSPCGDPLVEEAENLDLGNYICYIPRQKENILSIEMIDESGSTSGVIELSDYLESIGYDWTKPVLDDMLINIDAASLSLAIEMFAWENGGIFEVEQ